MMVVDSVLEKTLKDEAVLFGERTNNEIIADLKNHNKVTISKFSDLLSEFISLCKSSQNNPVNLLDKQSNLNNDRNVAFLEILNPIYDAYQKELKDNETIDFDDMIADSCQNLKENRFSTNYDYIIIDEFQDIGKGRFDLINEIKKQNSSAKTFCVGDDWQAIYRFAGADVSILFDFEKYFGKYSERLYLTQTFRFSKELATLSNKFVLKNPSQSKKKITSSTTNKDSYQFVEKKDDDDKEVLFEIIKNISEPDILNEQTHLFNIQSSKKDILILNRYRFDNIKSGYERIIEKSKKFKNINVKWSTIHKQKGGQADFVIIDDINEGFTGFPNKMGEDSVLHMVLEKSEEFIDAEERRLFYVAITRSKIKTYMVSTDGNSSTFFNEIYDSVNEKETCDSCNGKMVKRSNSKDGSEFLGCENFPICLNNKPV